MIKQRNYDYYNGDTWAYWIGPKPPITNDTNGKRALAELQRAFQRSNKIKECCDRVINGLVAKPFRWELIDQSGERSENPEIEKIVSEWLAWIDEKSTQIKDTNNPPIWDAVKDLAIEGQGFLRLWMPDRLSESVRPWQRLLLSRVSPLSVTLDHDTDGFIKAYSIRTSGGKTEKQSLDKQGNLTIESDGAITEYALDGNWLIFEMRGQTLITQDVIDAQNAINLARTMEARSLIQNGFVERVLTNAQLPGRWVEDDDPSNPTGQRFEADPAGLQTGPGMTSFVQGNPIYNEMGQVSGYTSPSVNYNNPAPIDTFKSSVDGSTALIYHAMGQGHLLASDTDLSGVSRSILRQDAALKISQYERSVVSAIEAMLLTFLRLMDIQDLRVSVQLCKANDYVSPEERAQILAEYNSELISKATAIGLLGTVDDVDAELALLESESDLIVQSAKNTIGKLAKEETKDAPLIEPPDNPDRS